MRQPKIVERNPPASSAVDVANGVEATETGHGGLAVGGRRGKARRVLNVLTGRQIGPLVAPGIASLILVIIVLVPIAMVILGSVNTGRPGNFGDWTLENYVNSLNLPWYWLTIGRTFGTALLSLLVGLVLTVPMAWVATRTDAPFARYFDYIGLAPLFISQFTIAVAWRLLASEEDGLFNTWIEGATGGRGPVLDVDGFVGIVWVSALYYSPYLYIFVSNALRLTDPALEDASAMSGASVTTTIRSITLPIIRPALLAGCLLMFMTLMGSFTIPLILGWGSNFHVLSTKIYELTVFPPAQYGFVTALSALSTLIGISFLLFYRRSISRAGYETVTGKGLRPRKIELGRWRIPVFAVVMMYAAVVVVAPYGVIILTALQRFTGAPAPYTLQNFEVLFNSPSFPTAVRTTLTMSVIGPTVAIILAGFVAWVLVRSRIRGRGVLDFVAMTPLAVPGMVFGVGVMWGWIRVPGIWGSLWIMILGLLSAYMAFGVRAMVSGFLQISPELEESASMSGASRGRIALEIIAPLMRPSIATGWILLFSLFFRNVAITGLLWSSNNMPFAVLGLELWWRSGYTMVAALALVDSLMFILFITVIRKITRTGLRDLI